MRTWPLYVVLKAAVDIDSPGLSGHHFSVESFRGAIVSIPMQQGAINEPLLRCSTWLLTG